MLFFAMICVIIRLIFCEVDQSYEAKIQKPYIIHIIFFFFVFSILDVWDVYRGTFVRIKRRVFLSESQPRNYSDSIIHCAINPNLFTHKSSYKLIISNHRIKIIASDLIGMYVQPLQY